MPTFVLLFYFELKSKNICNALRNNWKFNSIVNQSYAFISPAIKADYTVFSFEGLIKGNLTLWNFKIKLFTDS